MLHNVDGQNPAPVSFTGIELSRAISSAMVDTASLRALPHGNLDQKVFGTWDDH